MRRRTHRLIARMARSGIRDRTVPRSHWPAPDFAPLNLGYDYDDGFFAFSAAPTSGASRRKFHTPARPMRPTPQKARWKSVAVVPASFVRAIAGVPTAMIARGDDFPDALSAGPLAVAAHLPLILTNPDSLHPSAVEALRADEGLRYGKVIQVVDRIKKAGVEQIGFVYVLPQEKAAP